MCEVGGGQVFAGVLGGDPGSASIEDAHVGRVDVRVGAVGGLQDSVRLPDWPYLARRADQVGEAEFSAAGEEAGNVRGCVDLRVDAHQNRCDAVTCTRG